MADKQSRNERPGADKVFVWPERETTSWEYLIERYADGQPICNCGQAYYSPCGQGSVLEDGRWVEKTGRLACKSGCSANQLSAKEYIASRVLTDLEGKTS